MCKSQNIITSVSTIEGNFLLNDYHFRRAGQYYLTVCILQSFQKVVYLSFCQILFPLSGQPHVNNWWKPWSLPSLSLTQSQAFASFFSSSVQLPCGQARKMCWQWGPLAKASQITAASGNVDQSKPDSHFDSRIDPYISCMIVIHSTNSKGTAFPRVLPRKSSLRLS